MKQAIALLTILLFLGMAQGQLQAKPQFWETFKQTYAVMTSTPIGKAKCLTCHASAGPPELNPYGLMVKAALRSANTKEVTPDILKSIEDKDADGDNFTNGQEITEGTLPGDPKSHPDAPPPGGTHMSGDKMPGMSGHMANPGTIAPANSVLFPLHSFHPQIVHFPIALFIFGGLLEGLGLWKRRPGWREAGYICMAAASVTSLAAIATGLTAMFRNEYALKGNVLIHLILALSATLAMAITAIMGWLAAKKGKERAGWMYWIVLLISLLLVSIAGHWGGILVYG